MLFIGCIWEASTQPCVSFTTVQIMMLNSTQDSFGGRTYTTFFMYLMNRYCNSNLDFAGCCKANVNTIWVDVGESHAEAPCFSLIWLSQ